jgi:hypothetical protein
MRGIVMKYLELTKEQIDEEISHWKLLHIMIAWHAAAKRPLKEIGEIGVIHRIYILVMKGMLKKYRKLQAYDAAAIGGFEIHTKISVNASCSAGESTSERSVDLRGYSDVGVMKRLDGEHIADPKNHAADIKLAELKPRGVLDVCPSRAIKARNQAFAQLIAMDGMRASKSNSKKRGRTCDLTQGLQMALLFDLEHIDSLIT